MNEARVRDRDGDLWVKRADGWCCQAQCWHDGEFVTHTCDEHDHFTFPKLDREFGPLTRAPS